MYTSLYSIFHSFLENIYSLFSPVLTILRRFDIKNSRSGPDEDQTVALGFSLCPVLNLHLAYCLQYRKPSTDTGLTRVANEECCIHRTCADTVRESHVIFAVELITRTTPLRFWSSLPSILPIQEPLEGPQGGPQSVS